MFHFSTEYATILDRISEIVTSNDPVFSPSFRCRRRHSVMAKLMRIACDQQRNPMIVGNKAGCLQSYITTAFETRPPTLITSSTSRNGLRDVNSPLTKRSFKLLCASLIQNDSASCSSWGVRGLSMFGLRTSFVPPRLSRAFQASLFIRAMTLFNFVQLENFLIFISSWAFDNVNLQTISAIRRSVFT